MPVSLRFRCQYCDEQPDPLTQISLVAAMRQTTLGEYQDALPGRWLIFHGRGLFGPPRYACPAHRGDLVAYLRDALRGGRLSGLAAPALPVEPRALRCRQGMEGRDDAPDRRALTRARSALPVPRHRRAVGRTRFARRAGVADAREQPSAADAIANLHAEANGAPR